MCFFKKEDLLIIDLLINKSKLVMESKNCNSKMGF